MEGIIFLVFGLISLVFMTWPIWVIVLLVVWLRRRNQARFAASDTQQPQPQAAVGSEYEQGVRDTLEQVRLLETINDAQLRSIEQLLLPVEQPPVQVSVQPDTQPVAWVAEVEESQEAEPEVYAEEADSAPAEPPRETSPAVPVAVAPPPARAASRPAFNGLNILLLLSSLLFVAAGIAFIASPFADGVKLTVLIIIVGLFYGGGLGLHRMVRRLRPAAVAFIGTGLALIPFLGVAFAQYTTFAPEAIWLIISLLGMGAYLVAALVLKSQVVSYLTVAFLLSLVASAVANAHAPLSGYFVAMIGVSLVASIVGRLRPDWVPAVFRAPVDQTGNIVTPVALGASLLFGGQLSILEYEIIFALTTVHYAVARLQTGLAWHEQVARGLAHITLLIVAGDVTNGNLAHFGMWFVAVAGLQAAYSLWRWPAATASVTRTTELAWVWSALGLHIVAPILWADIPATSGYTLVSLIVLALTATAVIRTTKQYGFGFVLVYAGLVLPGVLGNLTAPAWPPVAVGAIWLAMVAGLIAFRYMHGLPRTTLTRWVVGTALVLYTVVAFVSIAAEPSGTAATVGLVGVAALMAIGSYAYRFAWIMFGVAAVVGAAFIRWVVHIELPSQQTLLFVAGLLALIMYVWSVVLLLLRDRRRGNINLVVAHGSAFWAIIVGIPMYFRPAGEGVLIGVVALLVLWTGFLLAAARIDHQAPLRRLAHAVIYPIFYLGALAVAMSLPVVWQAGVVAAGVILAWEASYRYRRGYLAILANGLTVWMINLAWQAAGLSGANLAYGTFIVAAALFYAAYWWYMRAGDSARRDVMLVSAWLAVGIAVLAALALGPWQQALALGLFIGMVWHASYVHASPYLLVLANVVTVWFALVIADWARAGDMVWYGSLMVTGALFYGLYHYYRTRQDEPRRDVMVGSAWVAVCGAVIASLWLEPWQQCLALSVLVGMLWQASYAYSRPYLLAVANAATVWLALVISTWAGAGDMTWYGSLVATAALCYGLYHYYRLHGDNPRRDIMAISAWTLAIGAWLASLGLEPWWQAAVLVGLIGLLWEISYAYRRAWTVAAANVALFWLFVVIARWQWPENVWSQLGVFAVLTAVLYVAAAVLRRAGDEKRQPIMLWSVWLSASVGYVTSVGVSELQAAASLLLVAGSMSGIEEGVRRHRKTTVEISVYVGTVGLMTLVHAFWPSLNSLFYAHLAALSIAVMAWWRSHDRPRYIVALSIVSLFSAAFALGHGGWYSLVFLVEHVAVTMVGAWFRVRWAAWWGIVGSVLAVFYYLRESPYLIFTLLGVLIVSFVVWRLSRKPKTDT